MIVKDESTVQPNGDGRYIHKTRFIVDEGVELDIINRRRMANSLRQKGFSDGRLMKFRAQIPSVKVWEAETILGYNLSDPKDFRKYLILHPEYIISPEDTGHTGHIIVKGE